MIVYLNKLVVKKNIPSITRHLRDVKPGNFCVGRPEDKEVRKIFILDFGMARKYVDNVSLRIFKHLLIVN